MPKIVTFTLAHLVLALGSGLMLGVSVFGVGFSDSVVAHRTYEALVILWQVLNAPAGIYVLRVSTPDWTVFGLLQLVTSFLWANAVAFCMSWWQPLRHNKPSEPTR